MTDRFRATNLAHANDSNGSRAPVAAVGKQSFEQLRSCARAMKVSSTFKPGTWG